MKDNKDLFDLFKENEHKIQPAPSRHAWDKLERKLDARKDINQTSKYRSIAQIAAVVAVVSIAAVIALLNTGSGSDKNMAVASERVSTWEEIALEKSGKNGNDLVEFNRQKEAKQVLMNEGSKDKKLVPKVNRSKSATNKIQNYNDTELVGEIDIASNTYDMHKAPLEREMLLGEVTINDKTTIEEIERKALGTHADGNSDAANIAMTAKEPVQDTKDRIVMADMADDIAMEVEEEAAPVASTTTVTPMVPPAPPTQSNNNFAPSTTSSPSYVITEVNAPAADTDISVGEDNTNFADLRIDNVSPADRKLQESIAESVTKVTKKRKSGDIFSRNKAKMRQSESMVPSIGIAADASVKKEKSYAPFSWLNGKWSNKENGANSMWIAETGNKIIFKDPTSDAIEFELNQDNSILFNGNTNLSYTYISIDDAENSVFKTQKEDWEYFVEIRKISADLFSIISYKSLTKEAAFLRGLEIVKEDMVVQVFVRE